VEASGATTDDPFAGTTAPPDDPFADTAPAATATAEEPPVVDKEGERVQPDASSSEPPAPAAEEVAQPPVEATEQPEATEPPAQPPVEPQAPAEGAQAPVEPQSGTDGGQEPPTPPTGQGTQDDGSGSEPDPEAAKAAQVRLYKLLYQTGPTTWEESQIPDEHAEVVPDEKHGPQRFLRARNNDHARRLAFVIHGRPEAGVTVIPVPASSFKPKRIKPKPPEPSRERLEIE
jgi:hypothetical protein